MKKEKHKIIIILIRKNCGGTLVITSEPSESDEPDPSFEVVCQNIGKLTTETVIYDYGCGNANFAIAGLSKYLNEKQLKFIEYIGVDIDKDNLVIAQAATERYKFQPPTWSEKRQNYLYQKLPAGDHSAIGDCKAILKLIKEMANATPL